MDILVEGDKCPECNGTLVSSEVDNCSCHINPPCVNCVENTIECNKCYFVIDEDYYDTIQLEQEKDND